MNPVNSWNLKKFLDLGVWGLEIFEPFRPRRCIKPWVQNPSSHFDKASMNLDESSRIIKSQKISWPWGLGLRNYIWATWTQKMYPTISTGTQLYFWQTGPHFFQNYNMNPIKFWNLKKFLNLGFWGLETTFGPLEPRRWSSHKSRTLALISTSYMSIPCINNGEYGNKCT